MILENFRQYKGKQELIFSDDSNSRKVSVVLGENGLGKTGIFRALMFCLYDLRKLSQDEDTRDSEIHLINIGTMKDNRNKTVKMAVKLNFEHNNIEYSLCREMRGRINDKGEILEEKGPISMSFTDVDGNTKFVDKDDIVHTINSILDKRIREFFLFDGEKIERLTRAGHSQKQEIKQGIRNLLKIDVLEKAIDVMKKLTKILEDEVKELSPEKLQRLLYKRQEIEDKLEEKKKLLETKQNEKDYAQEEFDSLEIKLENYKEIAYLINNRKEISGEIEEKEKRKDEMLYDMKHMLTKIYTILINNSISKVYKKIDEQKASGEIPPKIRAELIEEIIKEKKCICGRIIEEGTEHYNNIIKWKEKTKGIEHQDFLLNLWKDLDRIDYEIESNQTILDRWIYEYAKLRNEINEFKKKQEDISKRIGKTDREDITQLEKQRRLVQNNIIDLDGTIKTINRDIEEMAASIDEISLEIKEEEKKDELAKKLMKRVELARDTKETLETIHSEFTLETRNKLSSEATRILNNLLDDQSKRHIKKIFVKENYSLEVIDKYGDEFLANISAGQRQIVSIAFITALAKIASKGLKINYPLFMDTPFSRLSSTHRRNLINELPALCSQWILLTTGTEFTKNEARELKNGNNWSKFYKLNSTITGDTTITSYNPEDCINLLEERDELI